MKHICFTFLTALAVIALLAAESAHAQKAPKAGKTDAAAFAVFQSLAKEKPEENAVYSPLGLRLAMQLAYAGADGNTAAEINTLFGYAKSETFQPPKSLTVANAVWVRPEFKLLPSYNKAAAKLGAAAKPLTTAAVINAWCKKNTKGMIDKLFEEVPADAKIILTNALYFQDKWALPFDEQDTRKEYKFYNINGTEGKVPMMMQMQKNSKWDAIPYYKGKNFASVQLAYQVPGTSLVVVLPDEGVKFQDFCGKFGAAEFQKVLQSLKKHDADTLVLGLPKLKVEQEYKLIPALQASGIKEAFTDNADFSKMTGGKDLKIADVLQKVVFEMNEKETKAAAATAVTMALASAAPTREPKIIVFIADRPFLYILYDENSGQILFMGSYVKGAE